jgi:hypothetical protein
MNSEEEEEINEKIQQKMKQEIEKMSKQRMNLSPDQLGSMENLSVVNINNLRKMGSRFADQDRIV